MRTSAKATRRRVMKIAAMMTPTASTSARSCGMVGKLKPKASLRTMLCPIRNMGTSTAPMWNRKKQKAKKGCARQPQVP